MRTKKSWSNQTYRLTLIFILLLAVAAHNGQLFSYSFEDKATNTEKIYFDMSIEFAKDIFPETKSIEIADSFQYILKNEHSIQIGSILIAPNGGLMGFGGSVPIAVFLDSNNIVKTIKIDRNYESKDFYFHVLKSNLLSSWNNQSASAASKLMVQSVTGATFTSSAIIKGVQQSLSLYNKNSLPDISCPFDYKILIAGLLLVVFIFAFFMPSRFRKFRDILQILSIIVYGFWLGSFISLQLIINWLSNGVNIQNQIILFSILISSLGLAFFVKRSFYCTWICPYGASQDIIGKIWKRKFRIPQSYFRILKYLREALFGLLMFSLWIGFSLDLTKIEPFSVFLYHSVHYLVIILAVTFLVLSIFISRPWCRFFCPTGYILDFIKGKL